MRSFSELPPLSLYIHLPWCEKKCPYCDFNSHVARDGIPEAAYVDALLADLALDLPQVWGRRIESVFIGGGTPSLFSVDAMANLFSGIRALTNLQPGVEATMEANPGSVERDKFIGFRGVGVNRLSIGVQSFNDDHLQRLGRLHSGQQACRAIETAQAVGFESINVDIMFALPLQSPEQAACDIHQVLSFAPQHISYYQLTLEPNTLFYRQPPTLPDDDTVYEIQQSSQAMLADAGYGQYEVSAYAQQGFRCRHNLNYWQFGDYLGIGAGAHGKVTQPATGEIIRTVKQRQPSVYIACAASEQRYVNRRSVSQGETGFEFMLNAMRLKEGVPAHLFLTHTGLPLARFAAKIERAQRAGLLYGDHQVIRPTEKGFLFLNDLVSIFASDS